MREEKENREEKKSNEREKAGVKARGRGGTGGGGREGKERWRDGEMEMKLREENGMECKVRLEERE